MLEGGRDVVVGAVAPAPLPKRVVGRHPVEGPDEDSTAGHGECCHEDFFRHCGLLGLPPSSIRT